MSNDGIPPDDNAGDKPRKARRKVTPRASCWEHFTRLDADTSVCKYCGLEVGCNSKTAGTSPMNSHIKRCKMFKDSIDSGSQNVIGRDCSGNMKTIKYDPQVFRKSVMDMVVLNELPFSFVESAGFKLFCANVVPLYNTFSRRTAGREIVSMYMSDKAAMKSMFSNIRQRVSLTTDIWVAPTTSVNYMVVTGHWVDTEWKLRKRILSFKPITDHKGETIARHLSDCLDDWGIEKVFTVTVDNARGNDRALHVFRESFKLKGEDALVQGGALVHMRCCAHILNLIVKDGLSKVSDSVVAIRNAVKYVRSSYARLKSFELRCEGGNVCRGNLALDCCTRWNSTYVMLVSAIKLRSAFERMVAEDKLFCDYFQEEEDIGKKRVGPPSASDWDEVEVLVKFLLIFFNSTNVFSASNTVASTYAYNEIVTIERNLIGRSYNANMEIRNQALIMRDKFDKYWDGLLNMNPLVIIASVFDPRNKLQFATLCFEKLYGKDSVEFTHILAGVSNTMKNLFDEYNSRLGSGIQADDASSGSGRGSGSGAFIQLADDNDEEYERMDSLYAQMVTDRGHETSSTELEMYLMEKTEIRSTNSLGMEYDVLSWWKRNSGKFPVLSELAKDVLAIQVTSVASESAFSTSGRILDPYRSSLTPFMVEALICTQQWLRASSPSSEAAHVHTLGQMLEENDFLESLGQSQISEEDSEPLDPNSVQSIVQYVEFNVRIRKKYATGHSIVYNQQYPPENGLQKNYTSGFIHHVQLTGLKPNTLYQYRCGDPSLSAMSQEYYFRTMPKSTSESYPHRIVVAGDLGLTYNTSTVLSHILSNHPDLVVLIGGFSYADTYLANKTKLDCSSCQCDQNGTRSDCDSCYNRRETYQPRWDYWGRFMEPLTANVPTMMVAGEHEIEPYRDDNLTFVAYSLRFAFPSNESGSFSPLYYSFNAGGAHFIVLNSFTPYDSSSDQYIWLESDLRNINRSETPWVVATWSLPWYSTFKGHYRGAESMRINLEDLLYSYQVDIIFNSQVDAYERSNRVYNYTLDQCGPVYIITGAGGAGKLEIEHVDDPGNCPDHSQRNTVGSCSFNFTLGPENDEFCLVNQPDYSAYRESSLGFGMLEVKNETHALWSWNRNQNLYYLAADVIYIVRQPDICPVYN